MFTRKDKIKELAEVFAKSDKTECSMSQNKKYAPVGVSVVMTCKFENQGTVSITYDKWFVECFDMALSIGLPGTEHHDKLVKGSGVMVNTKNLGSYVFYGQDAMSIKSACEENRDLTSFILTEHVVNIR
jgi:hypothetical protein